MGARATCVGAGVISSGFNGGESFLSGRGDKVLDHVTGTNQEARESHMRAALRTVQGHGANWLQKHSESRASSRGQAIALLQSGISRYIPKSRRDN